MAKLSEVVNQLNEEFQIPKTEKELVLEKEEKEFKEKKKRLLADFISNNFEWDGADILDICQLALEDSNFHTLNKVITSVRKQQKIESDWDYCKNI